MSFSAMVNFLTSAILWDPKYIPAKQSGMKILSNERECSYVLHERTIMSFFKPILNKEKPAKNVGNSCALSQHCLNITPERLFPRLSRKVFLCCIRSVKDSSTLYLARSTVRKKRVRTTRVLKPQKATVQPPLCPIPTTAMGPSGNWT